MIDTGAAISLAPMSFAPGVELSPLESTLQLRSVTGRAIPAFGRRTIQIVGLSFRISFVIADVEHALLGMDTWRNSLAYKEAATVNTTLSIQQERDQLQQRGHLFT